MAIPHVVIMKPEARRLHPEPVWSAREVLHNLAD